MDVSRPIPNRMPAMLSNDDAQKWPGCFQVSHKPANANGSSDLSLNRMGTFLPPLVKAIGKNETAAFSYQSFEGRLFREGFSASA